MLKFINEIVFFLTMVSGIHKSRTLAKVQRKTPNGSNSTQYKRRNRSIAKCAVSKKPLRGIPRLTDTKFRSLNKSKKTISRPYGGFMSHKALKEKIMNEMVLNNKNK